MQPTVSAASMQSSVTDSLSAVVSEATCVTASMPINETAKEVAATSSGDRNNVMLSNYRITYDGKVKPEVIETE